jgi:hypothetical protein
MRLHSRLVTLAMFILGCSSDPLATTPDGGAPPSTSPAEVTVTAEVPTVRQGDALLITVTGADVSRPSGFAVAGCEVTLLPGADAVRFQVRVAAPHAAVLGPRDFAFTVAAGPATKPAAFVVTPICAAPAGNDANRGTTDSPFRTFTRALGVTAGGDTVELADGTYADGETWNRILPDKVIVRGHGAATVLSGTAAVEGLGFAGDATVQSLTVVGFAQNLHVTRPGHLTFENVRSQGCPRDGMSVDNTAAGATVAVTGADTLISDNAQSAIQFTAANGALSISGGATLISGSDAGVLLKASHVQVTVDGARLSAASNLGTMLIDGESNTVVLHAASFDDTVVVSDRTSQSTLDVTRSMFALPATRPGLQFQGTRLSISGTSFQGGSQQIVQLAGASVIRDSRFEGFGGAGMRVSGGTVDLGTAEPGHNSFIGPEVNGSYGLLDARPLAPAPITCSATTFNGAGPAAGRLERTVGNAASACVPGRWCINTVGNVLQAF